MSLPSGTNRMWKVQCTVMAEAAISQTLPSGSIQQGHSGPRAVKYTVKPLHSALLAFRVQVAEPMSAKPMIKVPSAYG